MNTSMVFNPTVGIEEDDVSDAGHMQKGGYLKSHINMDNSASTCPTVVIILILESSELMVLNKLVI